MIRPRLIPCLLLKGQGLVKTERFDAPRYLGDPINIVRIFNDKEVDELVLLDISAGVEGRPPAYDLIGQIASECFMPLCYGGGVSTVDQMQRLYGTGVEKVALNTHAVRDRGLVEAAAARFGSQSVLVSLDVRRRWFGRAEVYTHAGRQGTGRDVVEVAREMESAGAGELLLTAVDRDGTMQGYDLELVARVSRSVHIPVVACGGAGTLAHARAAVLEAGASAAAAGSMFVFQGPLRGVLVSYPAPAEIDAALG